MVIEKKYGSDWGWGADDVKKLSLVHMALAFGNPLGDNGRLSLSFFGLMWVMVLERSFGMMCDVEIILLKRFYPKVTVLFNLGRLLWRMFYV